MNASRQQTIDTYNQSAAALADYFKGIGPRIADIELAYNLIGDPTDASVLEIGCGDGYETAAQSRKMIGHTQWFEMALKKTS